MFMNNSFIFLMSLVRIVEDKNVRDANWRNPFCLPATVPGLIRASLG
jgi:hypothetical protein